MMDSHDKDGIDGVDSDKGEAKAQKPALNKRVLRSFALRSGIKTGKLGCEEDTDGNWTCQLGCTRSR